MSSETINPLSINGLGLRTYQSQLTIVGEILRQKEFRSFLIAYDSDGLKVFARVNIPSGEIPIQGFPVVVFAHGFSPDPLDPGYFQRPYYEKWINAYTRAGFLVMMPGYRGHGVVNGESADGVEFFEKFSSLYLTSPFYAIDVLNLVAGLPSLSRIGWDALEVCQPTQHLVNDSNIFLAAHSMGGEVGLIALAVSHTFKAASIWAGVCGNIKDIVAFYTQYEIIETKSQKPLEIALEEKWDNVVSTAREGPFFLNDVNLANGFFFLKDIETPIILHQGTGDSAVLPYWSTALHQKLLELGKGCTLYLYNGNNHELSLNNEHSVAIQRDAAFFRKHARL